MFKKLAKKLFPPKTPWQGKLVHIVDNKGRPICWGMVAYRDNPPAAVMLEFPLEGGDSLPRQEQK